MIVPASHKIEKGVTRYESEPSPPFFHCAKLPSEIDSSCNMGLNRDFERSILKFMSLLKR
jgi:hypothetical protein